MTKIKDWQARRAGGRITITGRDADDGQPIKVVGVDRIDGRGAGMPPIATDKLGDRYELV